MIDNIQPVNHSRLPMPIPTEIQPLLDEYVGRIEQDLPGLMSAFYLHGSIALGAFNPESSDIDFVTVVNRRCTPHDTDTLAEIHQHLAQKYLRWTMDGCYLQRNDLSKSPDTVESHPSVNEVFHPVSKAGSGWVTWWLLKQSGVAVIGANPQTLNIPMDWDILMADMHTNLNTYWVRFTRDPRRISWLFSDDGIQWVVLGVLRQFYTFREHDITSKIEAGKYGLIHLPQRWHRTIHEAIRIRQQQTPSLYRGRLYRLIETWQFLQYVIRICNQEIANPSSSTSS